MPPFRGPCGDTYGRRRAQTRASSLLRDQLLPGPTAGWNPGPTGTALSSQPDAVPYARPFVGNVTRMGRLLWGRPWAEAVIWNLVTGSPWSVPNATRLGIAETVLGDHFEDVQMGLDPALSPSRSPLAPDSRLNGQFGRRQGPQ